MIASLICLVVAIADGDTLTARCGDAGTYEQVKVRIAGIDAPEKKQSFGQRSKQQLAALCFQQNASIKVRSKDRYGRAIADVECQKKDVASAQVDSGMAWVYVQYAKRHQHLPPLQVAAKDAKRGLWADVQPIEPWAWRKARRGKKESPTTERF